MEKITKAEIDVLKAYRDNTSHNRSISVVAKLLQKGFLDAMILGGTRKTVITPKGFFALKEIENKE